DPCVVDELFRDERPVLTKITDTAPTRYAETASAKNSLIPAGCMVDGTVENSVLFRGVKVKKGAIVRNSIIMQSCTIGENAVIENVIIDRSNVIAPGTVMKGAPDSVVIMAKNELGK
ncbi:MAG: glucose-1-phosphate adenylyltransferase subunit GlgD, partial [Oscillospiraceae bacterium]|nr:glucose-1-phosphate adenylyltransferase subunit GlgD [Oscillospiraceae bacterium]